MPSRGESYLVGITIDNVSFSYDSGEALRDVSFQVMQGEFVGIIGPNGAGKSTLLEVISRILKPGSGAVYLEEMDIQEMSHKSLAREMGFVAQDSSIPFRFTVLDLVLMGRNPHLSRFGVETSEDLRIAKESMTKTRVANLAERAVTEISGGERQRVLIARALAQTPRILLLDEPTLHLDVSSQLEVMDLLKSLSWKEKLTIISVFHDFNMAARYCDRILLMSKGRVETVGPPGTILTRENIRTVFGVDVHVGHSFLTNSVYAIPIEGQKTKTSRKEWTVHLICGGGSGAIPMRRLVNEGWEVTAGVLNILDTDYEVAESLGISIATEAPFSPITEKAHEQNLQLIKGSNAVLVTDFLIGRGNIMNLQAAIFALKSGLPLILVIGDPSSDRDFTNGEGTMIVRQLIDMGANVTKSLDEALGVLECLRRDPLGGRDIT
jgi:iron complex transport system ATP-binding protein